MIARSSTHTACVALTRALASPTTFFSRDRTIPINRGLTERSADGRFQSPKMTGQSFPSEHVDAGWASMDPSRASLKLCQSCAQVSYDTFQSWRNREPRTYRSEVITFRLLSALGPDVRRRHGHRYRKTDNVACETNCETPVWCGPQNCYRRLRGANSKSLPRGSSATAKQTHGLLSYDLLGQCGVVVVLMPCPSPFVQPAPWL